MVCHPNTELNLLIEGTDLLDGAQTSTTSQRPERGRGILCVKEGIGKYDMWYGVVCKFSSNSNFSFSLSFQRDIIFLAVSFFLEKKENIKKGRKRAYQQTGRCILTS
jgi:hypothetical protein